MKTANMTTNLKPFANCLRAAAPGFAFAFVLALGVVVPGLAVGEEAGAAMQGTPPVEASQVTMANYLQRPYSHWAFRNSGAPLNVVMIPREGDISSFAAASRPNLGSREFDDGQGKRASLERIFEDNYADGLVVVRGKELLFERYFGGFNAHAQHIWFSMTKSLVSAAFGLLVDGDRVDLSASPAQYIPELRGSGFERVTIQQVLDHATAIDFKENYTDPTSDFFRFYAPALNMMWLPGAADVQPDADIYGVHDFLSRFVKPDPTVTPGEVFDYNSSNADVLGWLIARISGQPLQDYLQQHIWSRIGAEHDAYIAVDRAYMAVATGGMNTTARDAARFGMLIRDRGLFQGEQVLPARWLDDIVAIDARHESTMADNAKYAADPWQAYHNMWWVLDAAAGEFCAVGVHGQVIYINREADTVMSWFSSQPDASAAGNPHFHVKLAAARELARQLAN